MDYGSFDVRHRQVYREMFFTSWHGNILLILCFILGTAGFIAYAFSIMFFSWLFVWHYDSVRARLIKKIADYNGLRYIAHHGKQKNIVWLTENIMFADLDFAVYPFRRGWFSSRSEVVITASEGSDQPFLVLNSKSGRFLSPKRLVVWGVGKVKVANTELTNRFKLIGDPQAKNILEDQKIINLIQTPEVHSRDIIIADNLVAVIARTRSLRPDKLQEMKDLALGVSTSIKKVPHSPQSEPRKVVIRVTFALSEVTVLVLIIALISMRLS